MNKQIKRVERASRPTPNRPVKKSQQTFDYPSYFTKHFLTVPKSTTTSHFNYQRRNNACAAFNRLNSYHRLSSSGFGGGGGAVSKLPRLKFNQNSSSSSNSEFIRVLNRNRKMSLLKKQLGHHQFHLSGGLVFFKIFFLRAIFLKH